MKLQQLKNIIQEYMYMDDTEVIDVLMASTLANKLQIVDKVWLVLVGVSSGGKSQLLRPILNSNKECVALDDMTEAAIISGANKADGILPHIGKKATFVTSDLTVLMNKNAETKNTILSQFRMLYDGHLTKHSARYTDGPYEWKGWIGYLAGCTPTIYHFFEEVADMGQRFIMYRMKENDPKEMLRVAGDRKLNGAELDKLMTNSVKDYLQSVTKFWGDRKEKEIHVPKHIKDRLDEVALFCEYVRTPAQFDFKGEEIIRIPIPASPVRVAKQLESIVKVFILMNEYEGEDVINIEKAIDWLGFSLANEEKREILKILAGLPFNSGDKLRMGIEANEVADNIGLSTVVTKGYIQNLTALNIVTRYSKNLESSPEFYIKDESTYDLIRRILCMETKKEMDPFIEHALKNF